MNVSIEETCAGALAKASSVALASESTGLAPTPTVPHPVLDLLTNYCFAVDWRLCCASFYFTMKIDEYDFYSTVLLKICGILLTEFVIDLYLTLFLFRCL